MNKQSQKQIFWIGLLSFVLILSIPAQVAWAGHPAQTVPTFPPKETATSEATLEATSAATTQPTVPVDSSTAIPAPGDGSQEPEATATPRVFPTRSNPTATSSGQTVLASATATKTTASNSNAAKPASTIAAPALPTATFTQAATADRPVTASLTAVAAVMKEASAPEAQKSAPLLCSSMFLVALTVLASLAIFFFRRVL